MPRLLRVEERQHQLRPADYLPEADFLRGDLVIVLGLQRHLGDAIQRIDDAGDGVADGFAFGHLSCSGARAARVASTHSPICGVSNQGPNAPQTEHG